MLRNSAAALQLMFAVKSFHVINLTYDLCKLVIYHILAFFSWSSSQHNGAGDGGKKSQKIERKVTAFLCKF